MRRTVIIFFGICVWLTACSPQPGTAAPAQGHLPNVDWPAYHDDLAGFTIQHPLTWQERVAGAYPIVFALEAAPGTNLLEKTMEIDVTDQASDCKESTYRSSTGSTSPVNVAVNGIGFLKENGGGIAAGNIYDWTSYSTVKGAHCITLTFVLHSASSGVYATEPAPFDKAAESAIFDQLLNTFRFDQ